MTKHRRIKRNSEERITAEEAAATGCSAAQAALALLEKRIAQQAIYVRGQQIELDSLINSALQAQEEAREAMDYWDRVMAGRA